MTFFKFDAFPCLLILFLNYKNVIVQDITEDDAFKCTWQGGSIVGLTCNCQRTAEMTIKADSINSVSITEIVINDCKTLKIEENAIAHLRNLRLLKFNNIGSINFESDSVNWYGYLQDTGNEEERFDVTVPSLRVYIYYSHISTISSHAFAGRISELVFLNVIVDKINPLAFVNLLRTERIVIRDSVLQDIGVQSFKKISAEHLELINVSADLIPSRAISNITIYQNVTIDHCKFNTVRAGGFTIYNPKIFQVTSTNINHLNGEAFKVMSRGVVLFRNNTFGVIDNYAFRGIIFRRDVILNNILFMFDSNRVTDLSTSSLSMSEPDVQFRNIQLNDQCECKELDNKIKESSYFEEIMCLHENEVTSLKHFVTNMCSVISNFYMIIIVICVIIILILAILIGLCFYYKLVYKTEKYGDKKGNKNGNMSLIVPDGRTYRETELHVIVERTDLLTTDL